jgi:hypothetical protein
MTIFLDLIGILHRPHFQLAGNISIYERRLGREDVLIEPQKKTVHADNLVYARNYGSSLWLVERQHGWSFSIVRYERFKRPLAVSAAYLCLREVTKLRC